MAALEAARLLREGFSVDARVESSEGKDVKTAADREAQALILRTIAPFGFDVLAEESTDRCFDKSGPLWIIDPLDGTMNFVRGFPMACVSIALWEGNRPRMGVIVDVATGDIFHGTIGHGAFLNDQPIRVSSITVAGQAILACGFPSGRSYESKAIGEFVQRVRTYKKIRMLGSAALMLAQVAAGRFDAYFEEDIYLWDVAAGLALVEAAGGRTWQKPGSSPLQFHTFATNGRLEAVTLLS